MCCNDLCCHGCQSGLKFGGGAFKHKHSVLTFHHVCRGGGACFEVGGAFGPFSYFIA